MQPEDASQIIPKVLCLFSYSIDGEFFKNIEKAFTAREGQWVGAKVGLFCTNPFNNSVNGFVDVVWIHFNNL